MNTRRPLYVAFTSLALAVSSACVADSRIAVGADAGGGPQVLVVDNTFATQQSFFAFGAMFTGGVRVALADLDGDRVSDVIAGVGAGASPQVRAFAADGAPIRDFLAFGAGYTGGINVAAGDVDGDGRADIVVGAGGSGIGPQVRVYSGRTGAMIRDFAAFEAGFNGGVRVAAGDVDADGSDDILVARGPGAAAQVRVFSGRTGETLHDFLAYASNYTLGVFVGAADVNGDGRADIVTGTDMGSAGPVVNVFDGLTRGAMQTFFGGTPSFQGGVRVAMGDLNGDGFAELVTGTGPGGGPLVGRHAGPTYGAPQSFFAFNPMFSGGVFVATPSVPSVLFRDGYE